MWPLDNFNNNIAIIEENGNKTTYKQLEEYCSELTKHIEKRCLVFNLCSNEIGSLVGYVGFLNAKIVPLMLKADLDKELLDNFIDTYKPDYLNVPDNIADNFENCKKGYSNLGYTLLKT